MRRLLQPIGVLATVFGAGLLVSLSSAQDDAKEKKGFLQEFKFSLREGDRRKEWKVVGLDAQKAVKFEKEGMRITLDAGVPDERPHTGLYTGLSVKGDFEITVGYEIIKAPDPADTGKKATRILLIANHASGRAVFTRRIKNIDGPDFTTFNSSDKKFREHPARSPQGRMRLVRNGAMLSFWAAEADGKFEHLRETPFGTEDLSDVKLLATTGGPKAAFDVRFSDLYVRATGLPTVKAVVLEKPVEPEPAAREHASSGGWLGAVIVIGVGLVVALALLSGAILFVARRKGPPQPDTALDALPADNAVAFICPDCGKHLKAKPALAGKKVKCIQCGKAVPVPTADD